MPVIGHALVGLATAVQYEPSVDRQGRSLGPTAIALWVPVVVVVSYIPDILSQLGSMAGVRHAGLAGHSLVVGLAAGAVMGMLWAAATGLSFIRLMAVATGAILLHDVLDILQAADRAPFWPSSTRIVSFGVLLPRRSVPEGLLFLGLFGAFVIWRRLSGLSLGTFVPLVDFRRRASSAAVWTARAAVVAVLLPAVGTRALRSQRERLARDAARLNAQGRYAEALRLADTADRWPSVKPGQLDIIRGEAYEALGEPAIAERYFLRAYEEDPTNFWAVADLAEFHAASNAPVADRRRAVEPYADELKRNFPRHKRLNEVLARIDRKLGEREE
jgi:membrane-bound metal-dependent hydrolase YbcI (DUF457 family)